MITTFVTNGDAMWEVSFIQTRKETNLIEVTYKNEGHKLLIDSFYASKLCLASKEDFILYSIMFLVIVWKTKLTFDVE